MMCPPTLAVDVLPELPWLFWLAPVAGVAALLQAFVFARSVRARSEGEPEMVRIAAAVREGATAYLRRQYRVVALAFVGLVGVLGVLSFGLGLQPTWSLVGVPVAGVLSGLCGWLGMGMATSASARTAFAAKHSLNDGLTVAFRSGAVMGLIVVGFALLDISGWFLFFRLAGPTLGLSTDLREVSMVMLSFAMGASMQALFARVGGGIYTKAADVGADLVGKVEAGIPEDDPRNPATIADNVGDNVGDVAGMGADLYESYYGSILSTIALGAAAAFANSEMSGGEQTRLALALVVAPIALAAVGIFASIVGIFAVRAREDATFAQLLATLRNGVYLASALILMAAFAVPFVLLELTGLAKASEGLTWWGLGIAITAGLGSGLVIARFTEYYTSYEHAPTRRIALQAHTGAATVIIAGVAEGLRSTWAALVAVVAAILIAFVSAGGQENVLFGLYGVGIAAVGMLATLGITLATDAYGPIADNAGGNAEMSGQPPQVRQRTDMLDALGNTTAATGKGFAIGSAALTALALFAAYLQIVQVQQTTQGEAFARAVAAAEYRGTTLVGDADLKRPHAIYEGHGTFALVMPAGEKTFYDGGMLDPGRMGEHITEALKPGMVLRLAIADDEPAGAEIGTARLLTISAEIAHGDHSHEYVQPIIAARRATLGDVVRFYNLSLINPRVLAGLLLGVLAVFVFCALTMSAVGRAAAAMMNECRRQFAIMRRGLRAGGMSEAQIADPTQWPARVSFEGRDYPDYQTCVTISTAGAQREMVLPALLAITIPVGVGLTLGVPGVVGLLAGGLSSGFAMAVFMANAGGAWDNAKKLIESHGKVSADQLATDEAAVRALPAELRESLVQRAAEMRRAGRGAAIVYGKGSEDHKAAVVGDTVGDPFKDTSGPALNILVKLISIVAVVFAGPTVKYGGVVAGWLGLE